MEDPDEQTFFDELAERIAVLRKERGLTQAQLAERLREVLAPAPA